MSASTIPQHLCCPIRGTLMTDPVIVIKPAGKMKQGQTYERKAAILEAEQPDAFLPNEPLRTACLDFVLSTVISNVPVDSILRDDLPRAAASLLSRIVAETSIQQFHEQARSLASSCSESTTLHEMCKILCRSRAYAKRVESIKASVSRYEFEVKISCPWRRTFQTVLDDSMSVEDAKTLLKTQLGTSQKFSLLFEGTELSEDEMLHDCGVGPQSELEVKLDILPSDGVSSHKWEGNIFVKTLTGMTFTIACGSENRVGDVLSRLKDKEGVDGRLRVLYAGKMLDEALTLSHYNMKVEDTLHMITLIDTPRQATSQPKVAVPAPRPAAKSHVDRWDGELHVRTLTGKCITLQSSSDETVEKLKCKVQDMEGIPPDQQRLMFAGRQLDDTWTLAEGGVPEGGTVHLVLRLRGGMHHSSTTGTNDHWDVTFAQR